MKSNLKLCIAITICCAGLSTYAQGVLPFQLTDNFANRTVIFGPDYWITGSLSNATSEAGEPFIDGVSSGQTVWGTWTAPSNGIVTFSADADTFSPLLTVYTGDALNNLTLVASNNYLICYEDGHDGLGFHRPAHHPIGPAGVGQDDRQEDHHAAQHDLQRQLA